MKQKYDFMFKIILIGESQVGKTNIVSRFLRNNFDENSRSTIGIEFGSKIFTIDGHQIKAQFWDTSGLARFKNITFAYYKGVKGAL